MTGLSRTPSTSVSSYVGSDTSYAQRTPSRVRLKIVGKKVFLPDGVTQIGVAGGARMRGCNYAIWNGDVAGDAATALSEGQTFVRKLLRGDGRYGDPTADSWEPTAYGFTMRKQLDQFYTEVKRFTDLGIWVRAGKDSNCAVNGGTQGADTSNCDYCTTRYGGRTHWLDGTLSDHGHNAFTDMTYQGQYIASYVAMVKRICVLPYIHSWELAPEPMINGSWASAPVWDATWAPVLLTFMRRLIAAIRTVDHYTPFTAGPRSDYKMSLIAEALMAERNDVFYTCDDLSFVASKRDTHQGAVAAMTSLRDGSNVPISMQSVGVQTSDEVDWDGTTSANNYALKAALSLYNSLGIDWNYWSRHQNGTGRGGYSLDLFTNGSDPSGGYTAKEPQRTVVMYYVNQTLAALESAAQASAAATNVSNNAFLFYGLPIVGGLVPNHWKDSGKAVQCSQIGDSIGYVAPVVGSEGTLHLTATTLPTLALIPGPLDQRPAWQFDGSTQFFLGSGTLFTTNDDFTIVVGWVPAAGSIQTAFSVGTSGATEQYPTVQCNASNFALVNVHDDLTNTVTLTGNFFPSGGNASVISIVKSGTTYTLYVNGVQEAQVTGVSMSTIAPTRMRIGCNSQNQKFLSGYMNGLYVCKGTCSNAQRQDQERLIGYLVGAGIGV